MSKSAGKVQVSFEALTKEFEGGVSNAEKSLDSFDKKTKKTQKATKVFEGGLTSIKDLANGAFVGAMGIATAGVIGLAGVLGATGVASFNLSKDFQASQGVIQSELGVTADESERLNEVVEKVWGNNFGQNVNDVTTAIVEARRQTGILADDELQRVAEGALALRDSFEVDVAQSTQAVNVLMEKFGVTSDQALDMIATGFQKGLNNSGDFLDSVTEYGGVFSEGGASAEQFFSLLETGQQSGVLGTDKVADSFKELNATILDGSPARADALKTIGLNAPSFLSDLSTGKMTTIEAFQEIQNGLKNTENEAERNQASVALLGTMVEDMGFDSVDAINLTSETWKDNEGAIDSVSARYTDFDSMVRGLWRKILLEVKPFTDELLAMANDYMPQLEVAVGEIDTVIQSVIDTGQGLLDFYNQNKSLIDTLAIVIGSMVTAYYLVTAATWLWTTAMTALTVAQMIFNGTLALSPIGWVIIGIGLLIAAIVLLWMNWETISSWIQTNWFDMLINGFLYLLGPIGWFVIAWQNNLFGIQEHAGNAWNWLKANFIDMLVNGLLFILGPIGWLVMAWRSNFLNIQGITANIINNVMGYFDKFKNKAIQIKDAVVGAFRGIATGIGSGISSMISRLKGNLNNGIDRINNLIRRIPNNPIGQLPRLNQGGVVSPDMPYLVGDNQDGTLNRNTEMFVPNQRGRVLSASDTREALKPNISSIKTQSTNQKQASTSEKSQTLTLTDSKFRDFMIMIMRAYGFDIKKALNIKV